MPSWAEAPPHQPDGASTEPEHRAANSAASSFDALRGRTILVADAHDDTRELYGICLKSAGVRVLDAADGRDALVSAYGEHPDAIVADAQLPFIDGLELCRLLRVDAAMARVPVILVTTNPLSAAVHELWRAGANAAFTKPFAADSLLTELVRLLGSDGTAAPAGGADGDDHANGSTARDRRRHRLHDPQPFITPPNLRCPVCDSRLQYERSHAGGIGARGAEQWDYFNCARCGTFQYRHRTRKLRRIE